MFNNNKTCACVKYRLTDISVMRLSSIGALSSSRTIVLLLVFALHRGPGAFRYCAAASDFARRSILRSPSVVVLLLSRVLALRFVLVFRLGQQDGQLSRGTLEQNERIALSLRYDQATGAHWYVFVRHPEKKKRIRAAL